MSLKANLESQVRATFKNAWTKRDGNIVPEYTDVGLGNDAVNLDATILYADLDASTKLVDNYSADFAAEIYKTFLQCGGQNKSCSKSYAKLERRVNLRF